METQTFMLVAMAAGFFGSIFLAVYVLARFDRGRNAERLKDLMGQFGEHYTPVFRLGEMHFKAKNGYTPTPEDAIGIGRALWTNGAIRNGSVGAVQIFGSDGIRSFIVAPLNVDGRLRLTAQKIFPPGRLWSRREIVKTEEL